MNRLHWAVLAAALSATSAMAQQPEPAPAPAAVAAPTQDQTAPAAMPAPKPSGTMYTKDKKGKPVYAGPSTIVEQPATPMLDEEGRQRLDPDGKPMFNPPVKQQRDKKGHPLFDDQGKPVYQTNAELGYDEKGKKLKGKKEKPPKLVTVTITRGTLSIDGMTGKAALNYDIPDLKYIYLYGPGIGVVIISDQTFPGATEQKNAFSDKTLMITAEGHTFELYSPDSRLLGKKPISAFVRLDRDFKLPTPYPVMGYGTLRVPPYAWPGAKANKELGGTVKAPPLPQNLRPVQLLPPCPVGQMREATRKPLPGEKLPDPPCVPIKPKAAPAATPATADPTPAAPAPATPPQ